MSDFVKYNRLAAWSMAIVLPQGHSIPILGGDRPEDSNLSAAGAFTLDVNENRFPSWGPLLTPDNSDTESDCSIPESGSGSESESESGDGDDDNDNLSAYEHGSDEDMTSETELASPVNLGFDQESRRTGRVRLTS